MARPKKNRRYRDDEKAAALAALAANGGNVLRTAKLLGIPTQTITNWSKDAEIIKLGELKKADLAVVLEATVRAMLGIVNDKSKRMTGKEAMIAAGIGVDNAVAAQPSHEH